MAVPVRKNSVSDAIMERRLRPIYDYLDSGMNKKAINEGDRLLKKHANSSTIQALKAIAYLRLGKKDECLALITPIFESVPTDDNTIQALTVCYREMNKPEMVCQLLENSIKKDKSEDNLTYCFMSYVRVGIEFAIKNFVLRNFELLVQDFQKQHQIAMTLYKTHPKPPYFSWAVMSLLVKAIYEPPETADRITLPLAERMMSKFVEQQQVDSEYELHLYYLVLLQMKKYETCYEVLKNANANSDGMLWTPGKYIQLMWKCLKNAKKEELMMTFLEDVLSGKANMNCRIDYWKFYSEYVSECTKLNPKRVEEFLQTSMREAEEKKNIPDQRSILVAMLLFRKTNLHENLGGYVPSICTMDVFKKYIELCGAKSVFFYDVGIFFSTMIRRKEDFDEIIEMFENACGPTNGEFSVPIVTRKMNMALLHYNFNSSDAITDPNSLLSTSQEYIKSYVIHRKEFLDSKIKADIRDTQPFDSFLALASRGLLRSVFNNDLYQKLWEDKRALIPDSELMCQELANVNPAGEDIKYVLTDDDVPLFLSMAILEYGLDNSPFCSPLRILLGKAYTICGAAIAGAEQFQRLDLKHAQIESLGYLYFWKILRSGLLTDSSRLLSTARNFYAGHVKESMEHVLSGYKYGAWDKILEFMDFRKSIFSSLQSPLLKVEETLLEFTKEANSHDVTLVIAQKENFEVKSAIIDEIHMLKQNWDLNTMQNFERERILDKELKLLVEEERDKLRIRTSLSGLINSFLMLTTELKDENRYNYMLNYIDTLLAIYVKSISSSFEEYSFVQVHLEGPWSPTLWKYKKSGCPDILKKMFQLLMHVASDTSSPKSVEKIKSLEDDVNVFGESEIEDLKFSRHTSLVKIGKTIESMYSIVETFGFLTILADVLKCLLSKDLAATGKGKKRKNKEAESTWATPFDSLLHTILKRMKTFEEIMSKYHFKTGTHYPQEWTQIESSFKNLVSVELYDTILPFAWPKVALNLNTSYRGSFLEMLLTLELKKKYLQSLFVTPISSSS